MLLGVHQFAKDQGLVSAKRVYRFVDRLFYLAALQPAYPGYAMVKVLFDDVVRTDYGQFDIVWAGTGFDGDSDRWFAGQANGLVGAATGDGLYVVLGRRSGGSRVRIVLHPSAPPAPSERFEDVVEVSATIPEGTQPRWSSWASETHGPLDIRPGSYRWRVAGCGRDAGRVNELADGIVDEYVIDVWPALAEPDAITRVGSDDARYWHHAFGGSRPPEEGDSARP